MNNPRIFGRLVDTTIRGATLVVGPVDWDRWESLIHPSAGRAGEPYSEHLEGVAGGVASEISEGGHAGLWFHSFLSGPNGAHFTVYREPHHTQEDVERAKSWLRNSRDVTGFAVRRVQWAPPSDLAPVGGKASHPPKDCIGYECRDPLCNHDGGQP